MIAKLVQFARRAASLVTTAVLPNRRDHHLCAITYEDSRGNKHEYVVGFGVDANSRVREVFCSDGKSGSDRQSMLIDGCILISLVLRSGTSIAQIAHSMSEVADDDPTGIVPRRKAASPFGAVARAAVQLENELAGDA